MSSSKQLIFLTMKSRKKLEKTPKPILCLFSNKVFFTNKVMQMKSFFYNVFLSQLYFAQSNLVFIYDKMNSRELFRPRVIFIITVAHHPDDKNKKEAE